MNQVQIGKVASGRNIAGTTTSLVNARSLQLEFARMLHEAMQVPALLFGSETIAWEEKGRFRIRTMQNGQPQRLVVY